MIIAMDSLMRAVQQRAIMMEFAIMAKLVVVKIVGGFTTVVMDN